VYVLALPDLQAVGVTPGVMPGASQPPPAHLRPARARATPPAAHPIRVAVGHPDHQGL